MATNPQSIACAAFEAITPTVSMSPATTISGWAFKLTVRRAGTIVYGNTSPTITDATNGVFTFSLTTTDTGTTIGEGDFDYDIWRTNAGSEKRLVYGSFSVERQQWKP